MREKLDIGYKIENQSIIIHEIRPRFDNPDIKIEPEFAKATYVRKKNHWKIFWLRANLKWYAYEPTPTVESLEDFLQLIEDDPHGCFKG